MKGVNVRHLGHVRQMMLDHEHFRDFLLADAVARELKVELRARLRSVLRTYKMSESSCKQLVADFFNVMLLGSDMNENDKWDFRQLDIRKELEAKYPSVLTAEEKTEPLDEWKKRIDPRLIISECLHLEIMKLSPEVTRAIYKTKGKDFSAIKLLESDIVELCARVRHTHNFELWDALELQRKAKECIEGKAYMIYERMQEMKKDEYKPGEGPDPEQAMALIEPHTLAPAEKRQARRLLNRAQGNLYVGNLSYPLCPMSTLLWGDVLADLSKICDWDKAQRCFAKVCVSFFSFLLLHS